MTEEDNLISEKAVDYRPLQDFLKAKKWREADYETLSRRYIHPIAGGFSMSRPWYY
jgi:hypothetical protein